MNIKKATILGAGNMGSQIAALLVNAGLKVKLLDIVIDQEDPNKLSKGAFERITDRRKGQLYTNKFSSNLTYGNFDTDLVEDSDSDIFIEAVTENLEIKHDLWKKISNIAKPGAILTSNTSGIPIKDIAEVLTEEQQKNFLGFHFFNPPRYMKLVEIIPHDGTAPEVTQTLKDFTINILGKGVVEAKDVSGFVGNRIGVYSLVDVMYRGEQEGLTFEEIDALTGPIIGRPKTATYGLVDFVGADIAYNVTQGMKNNPEEAEYFNMPASLEKLVDLGYLGNKAKQGYFKRVDRKTTLVFDQESGDYIEQRPVELPILQEFDRNLPGNLRKIFESEDKHGKFLWDSIANVLYYSAINVPKATDDYVNVDRAMVWGYNWKLGPFQMWDAIGFEDVRKRLEESHGELPEWISQIEGGFYAGGQSLSQVTSMDQYISETIWSKENVGDLSATENDLLVYTLKTPANSLTPEFFADIVEAVKYLEDSHYRGMVLHSLGKNFSVGANLNVIGGAIKEGKADTVIPEMVDALHKAVLTIKHSVKPIVTAAQGQALGGGAELLLYSPFVVASAELYMGLVEVGVGLVPSGGGLAEIAERIYLKNLKRGEELDQLSRAFRNITTAKVSSSAYKAQEMGFLRPTDMIINNDELLLEAALKKADLEASYNYIPCPKQTYPVQGSNYYAIAKANIASMVSGNFASEYDGVISDEIAAVLAGGSVPLGTVVNQEYLMSLEKKAFTKLSQNQKTLDRIEHMLTKKRPLRN